MARSLAKFPLILTPRLRIHLLNDADVIAFQKMTDNPSITDAVEFLPTPFTLSDALQLLRTQVENNCFLGAWNGEELIGTVGAHLLSDGGIEIGYWISTHHQGQGYAYEATSAVIAELTRSHEELLITAECKLENTVSWKLLHKLGFQPTVERGHRQGRELLVMPRALAGVRFSQ